MVTNFLVNSVLAWIYFLVSSGGVYYVILYYTYTNTHHINIWCFSIFLAFPSRHATDPPEAEALGPGPISGPTAEVTTCFWTSSIPMVNPTVNSHDLCCVFCSPKPLLPSDCISIWNGMLQMRQYTDCYYWSQCKSTAWTSSKQECVEPFELYIGCEHPHRLNILLGHKSTNGSGASSSVLPLRSISSRAWSGCAVKPKLGFLRRVAVQLGFLRSHQMEERNNQFWEHPRKTH